MGLLRVQEPLPDPNVTSFRPCRCSNQKVLQCAGCSNWIGKGHGMTGIRDLTDHPTNKISRRLGAFKGHDAAFLTTNDQHGCIRLLQ